MLDWSRFYSLPGADTENFEKLCRGVVRRHFGYLGPLHELKNQPGVEFYITLNEDHPSLAKKNDTVGWQNKWFKYKPNGELTNIAKSQIVHSLDKTKEHVSHINHWFLWTHQTLAKCDQEWYFSLQNSYGFTLHLWNQVHLDELLSGPALDLRNTYFGELALTHEMLLEQHEKSIAPIKNRWLHEVHQQMDAELRVRQILGEKEAWDIFKKVSYDLNEVINTIKLNINKIEYSHWKEELITFQTHCKTLLEYCGLFKDDICGDDIYKIKNTLEDVDAMSKYTVHKTLMKLRKNNLPLSLTITNALAYIKDAKILFNSAIELLSQQFIAILADAGGGKTQLAAELTAQSQDRPAGILILGRSLKKDMGLDNLAKNFTFYQQQVNNFEALISAVNSVGERSCRRLPIVIDGLNEAQDPREWKSLLASVPPILKKYPNVVLVCTLRTSERDYENRRIRHMGRENTAQQSLPDSAFEILSEGYHEELTHKAINDYFHRYKIIADPFSAPLSFFSHPLNLKIFCEVINRKAETEVRVSYFPSSIYSLFREQINYTINSIVNMINLSRKFITEDIEKAIYYLGECLWEGGTRSIKEDTFKDKANIPACDWDSDIVNLLSQEGIIFRDEGEEKFKYELTPAYDLLGGFIVAEYLLEKNYKRPLNEWVSESDFIDKLFGEIPNQHPLSQDILHALIVLTPKTKPKQQLWKALPSEYKSSALTLSHLIDKDDLCSETLQKFKSLINHDGLSKRDIERLLSLRYVIGHPLNMEFLNEILLNQSVADRDLSWTEYLRDQSIEIIKGLTTHIEKINSGIKVNPEIIRLRIMFYSWHLTSTIIELRDSATKLLYKLGQQHPESLFKLTIDLLKVNDPYVSERLLASSYALATVLVKSIEYNKLIIDFSRTLYNQFFVENAPNASSHILTREYASCILKVINFHYPDYIQDLDINLFSSPFPMMPRNKWGCTQRDEEEYAHYNSPFRMDFENYTIGRLIIDRGNYDYSHEEYKIARGNILWRVNELGWNYEQFEKTERLIESDRGNYSRTNRSKIERYGKKYSWIAYYELAGKLSDEGRLDFWGKERFVTDIDPFFPNKIENTELYNHKFLSDVSTNTKDWILETTLPELSTVITVHEDDQDWILLDGFISEESKKLDRNFFCSTNTAFISNQDFTILKQYITDKRKMDWPQKYTSHGVYSGELYCQVLNQSIGENYISIEIGYESKTYEQPELRINDEIHIEAGTYTRIVPVIDNLQLISTIVDYYWENPGSTTESISRLALAPWIVYELGLQFDPSNFTYLDPNGKKSVLSIYRKGDTYHNYHDLMYLRKDLFELLSKQCEMTFVRRLLCEKKYAKNDWIGEEGSYLRFETIY